MDNCIWCNYKDIKCQRRVFDDKDLFYITCHRCGEYYASEEVLKQTPQSKIDKIGYILSGLSRELKETGGKTPEFLTTNLEKYTKSHPIPDIEDIKAKSDKILARIKEKTQFYGEAIDISYDLDYPLGYAKNEDEFRALLNFLDDSGYLDLKNMPTLEHTIAGDCQVKLTADGWKVLSNKTHPKKQGFIAIWFDPSMQTVINAVEKAIENTGFHSMCIKDKYYPDTIMDKALGEIKNSRFLVVDLTGKRSSVFFEAGFAYGVGKEIIFICNESEKENLEFYVKHYQCYFYKDPDELKEVLMSAIKARIDD